MPPNRAVFLCLTMTPLDQAKAEIARLHRELDEKQQALDMEQGRRVMSEGVAFMDFVGRKLSLTRSEAAVLIALCHGKGEVVRHRRLAFSLPSGRPEPDDYSYVFIPVLINRIRDQLGRGAVSTSRGEGYSVPPEVVACVELLRKEHSEPKPEKPELWQALRELIAG